MCRAVLTVLACLLLLLSHRSEADEPYNSLAVEIVAGLHRAASSHAKFRVALWPFRDEDVPVAPSVAREIEATLLSALAEADDGRLEFVARDAIGAVIGDMDATGALDTGGSGAIAALLQRASDIDALLIGRMRRGEAGVSLSWRAVRVSDFAVLAAAGPRELRLSAADRDGFGGAVILDVAVRQAAEHFIRQAADLRALLTGGIRFQTTGARPPFGRLLQDRLVAALESGAADLLTGRKLRVSENAPEDEAGGDGDYVLSGRYWDFGPEIEVRLRLRQRDGRALGWHGRIARSSVAGIRLRPIGDFGNLRDNDGIGPFAFSLTTSRGHDPSFRIGESMDLLLQAERDFWLYCFYRDAQGGLAQIFPNPELWRHGGSVRLSADRRHRMPGPDTYPFALRFTPPAGLELVKCFASLRDITAKLPEALQGRTASPVPAGLADNLSWTFREAAGGRLNEASVVVTVRD